MPGILADLARRHRFAFPVASVVEAIVCGRVLEPGSERALVTSWLSGVHDRVEARIRDELNK